MRSRRISQFVLFTILLFITACGDNIAYSGASVGLSENASESFDYIQTVDGVEFKVGFDKKEYIAGDDITVTVIAKNVSGGDLKVWSLTDEFGKNGAITVDSYIDGEMSYISNSRDLVSCDNEYEGVLENRESIRCRITFYTDTIYDLTEENYTEIQVCLGVVGDAGERNTVGIMVPVNILFN